MQKITPFLWFDRNAEEAVDFYCSIFKSAKKGEVTHYPEGAPMPKGTVMTVSFKLEGQDFTALNGGPEFKFNNSVSFTVYCETQEEIDLYWAKLTADGGKPNVCGWLQDKYGLSWQINPAILPQLISDRQPARAARVLQALWRMGKLDLEELKRAAEAS
jgi:predicted 3-demethylubiquinone-9 3-methyltransferase (glyoxalase superfamily)